MAEKKKSIEDVHAESYDGDRRLDEKLSSENPDRVQTFNRRADRKRARASGDVVHLIYLYVS